MQAYHDNEWGIPVHDDRALFELLTLEGAQAGLSWETVLRKRERYRTVFAGFDLARVARFTPARIERIVLDPGLIRHRGKIESVVSNARSILAIAKEFGSFDAYLWGFTGGKPIDVHRNAPIFIVIRLHQRRRRRPRAADRRFRFRHRSVAGSRRRSSAAPPPRRSHRGARSSRCPGSAA